MSLKILLTFLSTVLLVQSSYCKTLISAEDTDDVTESPDIQLMVYVLGKFVQLADTTLADGKKILQDVVTDICALENKNEEVSEKLEKYKNFLTKLDQLKTETRSEEFKGKFDMMTEMSDLVENSNTTSSEESNNADKLFAETLKKHGFTDLEEVFEKKFEEFSKEFIIEITKVIDARTVEEWPGKIKVQEWLNKFKTMLDVEKKMDMFENFFELFD